MKKIWILGLVIVLALLPATNSVSVSANVENTPHVSKSVNQYELEVFADTPNELGVLEVVGYSNKISVYEGRELSNRYHFTRQGVVDYYDNENNYLYSELYYEDYNNNYINGKAERIYDITTFSEPLIKEIFETDKERERYVVKLVKEHLDTKVSEEVEGVSHDQLEELRELREKAIERREQTNSNEIGVMPTVVSNGGAFDNYFNLFNDNTFLIQGEGPEDCDCNAGKYFRVEASFKVAHDVKTVF